jgi:hypothetical protein
VLLVGRDQPRVRLGEEMLGKLEHRNGLRGHVIHSDIGL